MAKLKLEDIEEKMEEEGYTLLSYDYEGCYAPLDIKCPKGHEYQATWSNFNLGKRCPVCNNEKKQHTVEWIREQMNNNEDTLISSSYKNYNDPLNILCKCGQVYTKNWTNYQQGKRCTVCAYMNKLERKFKQTYEQEGLYDRQYTNWYEYNHKVRTLSEHNYVLFKDLINPHNLVRGLSEYHIDHILSISEGFKKNISIETVSHPANLQLLRWTDNLKKQAKSEQTIKQLMKKIDNWTV